MMVINYTQILETFITEFRELNATLEDMATTLDALNENVCSIVTNIRSGDAHSVAEEILETRYQIKEAILDAANLLKELNE